MARWKPIESAPINKEILVDGGTLYFEVNAVPEEQSSPVKVITKNGTYFSVCDTCGYETFVANPLYWTDLPSRALLLELPRPAEYDL